MYWIKAVIAAFLFMVALIQPVNAQAKVVKNPMPANTKTFIKKGTFPNIVGKIGMTYYDVRVKQPGGQLIGNEYFGNSNDTMIWESYTFEHEKGKTVKSNNKVILIQQSYTQTTFKQLEKSFGKAKRMNKKNYYSFKVGSYYTVAYVEGLDSAYLTIGKKKDIESKFGKIK